MPPVMILCGGRGTRLREVTELLPKPMVPIGDLPIIWHIMKCYAAFGVRRFILCLGYKREEFIDFFLNYRARTADMTLTLGNKPQVTFHSGEEEADWEVTLVNTGEDTKTGGRILRASRYLKTDDENFFLKTLESSRSCKEKANLLIEYANHCGGADNITAVVIKL